jgi:hypothetical protein
MCLLVCAQEHTHTHLLPRTQSHHTHALSKPIKPCTTGSGPSRYHNATDTILHCAAKKPPATSIASPKSKTTLPTEKNACAELRSQRHSLPDRLRSFFCRRKATGQQGNALLMTWHGKPYSVSHRLYKHRRMPDVVPSSTSHRWQNCNPCGRLIRNPST